MSVSSRRVAWQSLLALLCVLGVALSVRATAVLESDLQLVAEQPDVAAAAAGEEQWQQPIFVETLSVATDEAAAPKGAANPKKKTPSAKDLLAEARRHAKSSQHHAKNYRNIVKFAKRAASTADKAADVYAKIASLSRQAASEASMVYGTSQRRGANHRRKTAAAAKALRAAKKAKALAKRRKEALARRAKKKSSARRAARDRRTARVSVNLGKMDPPIGDLTKKQIQTTLASSIGVDAKRIGVKVSVAGEKSTLTVSVYPSKSEVVSALQDSSEGEEDTVPSSATNALNAFLKALRSDPNPSAAFGLPAGSVSPKKIRTLPTKAALKRAKAEAARLAKQGRPEEFELVFGFAPSFLTKTEEKKLVLRIAALMTIRPRRLSIVSARPVRQNGKVDPDSTRVKFLVSPDTGKPAKGKIAKAERKARKAKRAAKQAKKALKALKTSIAGLKARIKKLENDTSAEGKRKLKKLRAKLARSKLKLKKAKIKVKKAQKAAKKAQKKLNKSISKAAKKITRKAKKAGKKLGKKKKKRSTLVALEAAQAKFSAAQSAVRKLSIPRKSLHERIRDAEHAVTEAEGALARIPAAPEMAEERRKGHKAVEAATDKLAELRDQLKDGSADYLAAEKAERQAAVELDEALRADELAVAGADKRASAKQVKGAAKKAKKAAKKAVAKLAGLKRKASALKAKLAAALKKGDKTLIARIRAEQKALGKKIAKTKKTVKRYKAVAAKLSKKAKTLAKHAPTPRQAVSHLTAALSNPKLAGSALPGVKPGSLKVKPQKKRKGSRKKRSKKTKKSQGGHHKSAAKPARATAAKPAGHHGGRHRRGGRRRSRGRRHRRF